MQWMEGKNPVEEEMPSVTQRRCITPEQIKNRPVNSTMSGCEKFTTTDNKAGEDENERRMILKRVELTFFDGAYFGGRVCGG